MNTNKCHSKAAKTILEASRDQKVDICDKLVAFDDNDDYAGLDLAKLILDLLKH